MRIAIDYDNTFTLHPAAWTKAIEALRSSGAEIICISSRFPNVSIEGIPVPVYYSCGQLKWEFAHERGLEVDIWIDDIPSCIGERPDRRGFEPGQAQMRRDLVRQIFDANFNAGPYNGRTT